MSILHSKDGTAIAYEKKGKGLPLILVDGALCTRKSGPNGPLAELMQQHFTVYFYDRRGRGESGDAKQYRIEREIEDISALIEVAGGSAYVYGISSGAALALEAANQLSSIKKLAIYEAPFIVDHSRAPIPSDYMEQLQGLLATDRHGAAVKHFMRKGVGLPAAIVAMMPLMPAWKHLKAAARTLPYDTLLTLDYQRGKAMTSNPWPSVTIPTLVAVGGKSPGWTRNAMQSLANVLPNAKLQTLEGQTHIIKAAALAPVLKEYFEN